MRIHLHLLALAFLVGFLDFLVFHLYRPRLRNAFLAFFRQKLVFLSCAAPFGLMAAAIYLAVQLLLQALGADPGRSPLGWIGAVVVPLAMHHVTLAWPARGRFGDANQRIRFWFPYQSVWERAGRHIEGRHSHDLELLAAQYASVPWDDDALARIHARIVPHYREKQEGHRVNPQLLVSLRRFREQHDTFAFFYALLEEFGPRRVDRVLGRL
jgi:hypothetical protein